MSILRAQITLPKDSNRPEDACVNRLHFQTFTTPSTAQERSNIILAIEAFYDGVAAFLSPNLTGQAIVRLYDMADPEPRVPLETQDFTFTPSTSDPFPSEVGLRMNFQAAPVSGQPQARRRNAITIGPVAGNSATVVAGVSRPSAGFRGAVEVAAEALMGITLPSQGALWIVRSETYGTFAAVSSGWTSDKWATQRRRGEAETVRTPFG